MDRPTHSARSTPAGTYNFVFTGPRLMEADRVNAIEASLADLAARAAELRRYL